MSENLQAKIEFREHLKRTSESVCALLGFLFDHWLEGRAAHASLPAPTIERTEKPMTVKEAAEFYGVQENTIYELVKRREIRFIKIGESLRIPPIQPVEPLTTRQPCATKRRRNVLQ